MATAPLVGRRVRIEGLASKPELNGTEGTAIFFDVCVCVCIASTFNRATSRR
ncbi:hypothetical protein T492DRAFT_1018995 [Pavlovales sp. CCMP2436]|nr:hypothetical protein T492DRAFT_1018995 [Pavlovales sp. CCMP2436]